MKRFPFLFFHFHRRKLHHTAPQHFSSFLSPVWFDNAVTFTSSLSFFFSLSSSSSPFLLLPTPPPYIRPKCDVCYSIQEKKRGEREENASLQVDGGNLSSEPSRSAVTIVYNIIMDRRASVAAAAAAPSLMSVDASINGAKLFRLQLARGYFLAYSPTHSPLYCTASQPAEQPKTE